MDTTKRGAQEYLAHLIKLNNEYRLRHPPDSGHLAESCRSKCNGEQKATVGNKLKG